MGSCASCPCGKAAGVGQGGRCPLVDRARARGEFVYLEGEPASHIWFVKRGSIVLTRSGPDDERQTPRAVRRAGSFIGLEALVQETYRDTARVAQAAVLCSAPRDRFDEWLGSPTTPIRMVIEQMLYTELSDAPRAATADGSALARVAQWVLRDLAMGVETPVQRRYTAGLLGMTPETLSRSLARLRDLGVIELSRRTLRVVDELHLRRIAGHVRQRGAAGDDQSSTP